MQDQKTNQIDSSSIVYPLSNIETIVLRVY